MTSDELNQIILASEADSSSQNIGNSLEEKVKWEEDIYRIQVSDPILGGEDGIVNIQPRQIANRTQFLKTTVSAGHDIHGGHMLFNSDFSTEEKLPEDMLLLDVPTETINKQLADATKRVEDLDADLQLVIGADGNLVQGLAKSILLMWKYADYGFDLEMFTDDMKLRDIENRAVAGAVSGDDSIDIKNPDGILEGMRLLIADEEHKEEVEVRSILDLNRIRVSGDLQYTYSDNATIGQTNWEIHPMYAVTRKNGVYYSRITNALRNCVAGNCIIRRDGGDAQLNIYSRDGREGGDWEPADLIKVVPVNNGEFYDEYYSVCGGYTQVKIVADGVLTVYHIALFPPQAKTAVAPIRTPKVLAPVMGQVCPRDEVTMRASRFLTAYNDTYVKTEFAFIDTTTGETAAVVSTTNGNDTEVIFDESVLPQNGPYRFMCRHMSDIGDWSNWSAPIEFILKRITTHFGYIGAYKVGTFNDSPMTTIEDQDIRFGFTGAARSAGFGVASFTTKLTDD